MKIGFPVGRGEQWQAGVVYLMDLFQALRETGTKNLTLCLLPFHGEASAPEELGKLADEILLRPVLPRWTALWAMDVGFRRILRRDLVDHLALKRHRVEVIALGMAPRGSRIPMLGWLPDFQHIHLPDMFSPTERQARDRSFQEIAERSTRVILLSETVARDFLAFAPTYASKVRVLSPVSSVPRSVYESDPRPVCDAYHLPDKFIYLPNQFWKHKNHGAVFRALKILRGRGLDVFLVMSGYPGDYRHPHYFSDLLREVSELGIRQQVAFLGLIPRLHVFMLIRQSVCLLNPSLFEGYGLTVGEARSVGKAVVVSDIPAHREQELPQALFFDPRDCEDLAANLAQIWREKSPGPDRPLEEEARIRLPDRIRLYGTSFLSVVREALGH